MSSDFNRFFLASYTVARCFEPENNYSNPGVCILEQQCVLRLYIHEPRKQHGSFRLAEIMSRIATHNH